MKRQVGTKISAKLIKAPCCIDLTWNGKEWRSYNGVPFYDEEIQHWQYALDEPLHTAHFYSAAYIPETFVPMLLITKFGGAFMAVAEEQGSAGGKRYVDANGNKLHEQDIREFAIWSEE